MKGSLKINLLPLKDHCEISNTFAIILESKGIVCNIDMRIATEEQLLRIFISRLDRFIEYNTDTSAGHPVKDDDIVRYSEETQRVKDKEP